MSLVFYYSPMSTASITQAVIAELDLACDRVVLDIDAGDTRDPKFLEINPNGRVPVIVHEGVTIWESAAITIYLGETFGTEAGLYPIAGPERGEAMKWIVWSNRALAEAAGRMSAALPVGTDGAVQAGSKDVVPSDQQNGRELDRAETDVTDLLGVLDDALSCRVYLLGEYSLADTHVHGFVSWLDLMGVDLSAFASVSRWAHSCRERPALVEMFAD